MLRLISRHREASKLICIDIHNHLLTVIQRR